MVLKDTQIKESTKKNKLCPIWFLISKTDYCAKYNNVEYYYFVSIRL